MKRDPYWDSLKFLLVFLVVLDHCIGIYKPSGGINQPLQNFICTFFMPLFIFVSGMFSHIRDREKYKLGILRIIETYIVFQFIRAVVPMLISGNVSLKSVTSVIVTPRFALWYLLSLIYWRIIVLYIPEKIMRDNPKTIMSTCFLVSLWGGVIPVGGQLSIQRTMCFLPFFFMGYYAKDIKVKKYIARIPLKLDLVVLLSVFLIYFIFLDRNLTFILSGKVAYWSNDEFSPLLLCLFRFIFLISAIITGAMIMRLVLIRPSFSLWGQITLFIYIYHTFLIQVFRFLVKQGYLPHNEWICIAMSVIITAILLYLSKIKFLNFLLNPISCIYGNGRILK